jgi:hypothetical protein
MNGDVVLCRLTGKRQQKQQQGKRDLLLVGVVEVRDG